jgi:hypothetical protein
MEDGERNIVLACIKEGFIGLIRGAGEIELRSGFISIVLICVSIILLMFILKLVDFGNEIISTVFV